ncbi:MAG: YihY/virulence factor BrkB family protein [Bifidobacteriaceae bacterium]|jgi:membrane protein|nr:YihY/virulence factor BrkB family protein [Bifidobacteriaceae bacterium]
MATKDIWAVARRAAQTWQGSRAGRTLKRYSAAGGGLLAGGIAYSALFSLSAVLTIAFTVTAVLLGSNPTLANQVDQQLTAWLPGALNTGHGGLITPGQLTHTGALTITSVVAALVLVWSASSVMAALRTSIRTMFGLPPTKRAALMSRLTGLAGFGILGAALLVSAVASLAVAAGEDWLRDSLHSAALAAVMRWLAYGLSLVVDAGVVALLFWAVAGARPARKDLLIGSLAAGCAMGLAKHIGVRLVAGAASNLLIGAAATVATLLVWVNLMARVVLYAAAWTAETPGAAAPRTVAAG